MELDQWVGRIYISTSPTRITPATILDYHLTIYCTLLVTKRTDDTAHIIASSKRLSVAKTHISQKAQGNDVHRTTFIRHGILTAITQFLSTRQSDMHINLELLSC